MVWLVAWRELRDQLRDWRIIFPMFILTIVLPIIANAGAQAAVNFTAKYDTPLIAERLVPFLLMVVGFFPITVSLVIALEAFVGEKERGTIEPLLVSPLNDWQIYSGKLLAGTIAPLVTAYLGVGVYLIGLALQHIPFPDPNRLAQTLILTTVQGFLMVSGAILISTQSTSVRAANLMASFIVIPMGLLIQGEAVLLFWGNDQVLWLAVVGVSVLTVLLARVGITHFHREALLGREIDILNLRWVGTKFWQSFKGSTRNLWDWYRIEVRGTLHRLAPAIWITLTFGVIAVVAGYLWTRNYSTQFPDEVFSQIKNFLPVGVEMPTINQFSFAYILGHNLRAVLLIFLLGMVSFGTLGILMYSLNAALIGAVVSLLGLMGFSPWRITLAGILPHGIFELTALVLTGASILFMAVMLVTPRPQRSLGEVAIEAVADCTRIFIGLIVPLLAISAVVETWITPILLSTYGK